MKNPIVRKTYSKKHHYLPVFYLNGFTNNEELLVVYDKVTDKILPNQKPESQFYQKHLNNFKDKNDILFTFEEPYFTPLDSSSAAIFAKIRGNSSVDHSQLSNEEKWGMLAFVSTLFWRSPHSNSMFKELITKEGFTNIYFGLYRWNEGNKEWVSDTEIPHIIEDILKDEQLQRTFKHMIPISDAGIEEIFRLFTNWKVSYVIPPHKLVTGDCPFIYSNPEVRLDNVFGELIFPLSQDRMLLLTKSAPTHIDSITLNNINLSVFIKSYRFVACSDQMQIELLRDQYKEVVRNNVDIVGETFKRLDSHLKH